jgi:hypothetical protein
MKLLSLLPTAQVIGLALALITPTLASAQVAAPAARDGRTMNDEPLAVRQLFAQVHGQTAPQQWQREHNIAIRRDLPQASDGRTIQSEPTATRAGFVAIWGGDAPAKWAVLHSYDLGKGIILASELEEAIEAAEDGDLAQAQAEYRSFAATWEADHEPYVREKLPDVALALGAKVRAVTAVLITPPNPVRAQYLEEMDELMEMIEAAQKQLAALPASPFTTAPPSPPRALAISTEPVERAPAEQRLRFNLDPQELESALSGVRTGNLARATGEFQEFIEQFTAVENQVRSESPTAYAEISEALNAGRALRTRATPATAEEWAVALDRALRAVQKYLP